MVYQTAVHPISLWQRFLVSARTSPWTRTLIAGMLLCAIVALFGDASAQDASTVAANNFKKQLYMFLCPWAKLLVGPLAAIVVVLALLFGGYKWISGDKNAKSSIVLSIGVALFFGLFGFLVQGVLKVAGFNQADILTCIGKTTNDVTGQ